MYRNPTPERLTVAAELITQFISMNFYCAKFVRAIGIWLVRNCIVQLARVELHELHNLATAQSLQKMVIAQLDPSQFLCILVYFREFSRTFIRACANKLAKAVRLMSKWPTQWFDHPMVMICLANDAISDNLRQPSRNCSTALDDLVVFCSLAGVLLIPLSL